MDVDQAIRSELRLLSPEVRRSPADLDALLHPDFREVGASGRLWTRAEIIDLLAGKGDDEPEISVNDLHDAPLADGLVLVTYLSDQAGRRAWRATLWRHTDEGWRALYHQGTLLS